MSSSRFIPVACALAIALALGACKRQESGTPGSTPSSTMAASGPASAASQ
jgi:hypothetical protein